MAILPPFACSSHSVWLPRLLLFFFKRFVFSLRPVSFHRLAWSQPFASAPGGLIVGGHPDGVVCVWNSQLLLRSVRPLRQQQINKSLTDNFFFFHHCLFACGNSKSGNPLVSQTNQVGALAPPSPHFFFFD
jgi:hypothetical protein